MTGNFKVGDVVRLLTGGPRMTVERVAPPPMYRGDSVSCVWFVRGRDGFSWSELQRAEFECSSLVLDSREHLYRESTETIVSLD